MSEDKKDEKETVKEAQKIIDMSSRRTGKGFRQNKKPTKAQTTDSKIEYLEQRLAFLEHSIQNLVQESFHHNANGAVLFRCLEDKEILTEEDIKTKWTEIVEAPYEEAKEEEVENIDPAEK